MTLAQHESLKSKLKPPTSLCDLLIMNRIKIIITALIASTLISTSAFAAVGQVDTTPRPVHVVEPTDIPRHYIGETVKVTFLLDEAGQPSDVKLVDHANDKALAASLLPAVAQWKFTPLQKDGESFSHRVMLPIELIVQN